jgi:imidazolonepropionase-like amidohydrolase
VSGPLDSSDQLTHKSKNNQYARREAIMARIRKISILIVAIVLASCANGTIETSQNITIIDHVTVLDGRGGPAIENARVIVRGDRIASVLPPSAKKAAARTVIDGEGRLLVPGYIDMHAHLLFPRCSQGGGPPRFDRALSEKALSRQLHFGITTVRSPATPTVDGLKLRDDLKPVLY